MRGDAPKARLCARGRRGADDGKERVERLRGDCDAGRGCRKIKSVVFKSEVCFRPPSRPQETKLQCPEADVVTW